MRHKILHTVYMYIKANNKSCRKLMITDKLTPHFKRPLTAYNDTEYKHIN